MKKNLFLLSFSLSFFLLVSNCYAQITFQKVISTPVGCEANAVEQTNDGGYIIAGYTVDTVSFNDDVYLIKTDASGDTLWTRTFAGTNDDAGYSVEQTADGGYIVAEYALSPSPTGDLYIIKTNATGDTLWTKAYGGDSTDAAYFVRQTNDSGYIIAGATQSFGAGGYDVYLVKTNASGDTLWTKTYGGGLDEYGYCVKQTADSGYIICGATNSFGIGYNNVYLIKTKANGDTLWTKTYSGGSEEYGYAVQQTADGGYIITGKTDSFGAGDEDVLLIKTTASGDTLWTKTYGGSNLDVGYEVEQTTDSGYIIVGVTASTRADSDNVYLIKTDAGGDTLWTSAYGGIQGSSGNAVRQTSDGGYIIAGNTGSFNPAVQGSSIYLIKTDAIGNSGCYQSATNTFVGSAPVQVLSTNTVIASGGAVNSAAAIVGSGADDSTLCLAVGIHEVSINNVITLYPDPADKELRIRSDELKMANATIYIMNTLGQTVSQSAIANPESAIDISFLPSGIFFVRVYDEKESWVGKFVKE